jgi:DNA-binding PadR family transcriptional regulator
LEGLLVVRDVISESVKRYIQAFDDVGETLTVKEIAQRINVSEWAVYRALKVLVEKGYVRESQMYKSGKRGRPIKTYTLTEKGHRLRKALGGAVDVAEIRVMLQPAFRFLDDRNLVRSIAVLERFLNDRRKNIVERKIALCMWVVYLIQFSKDMLMMPDISDLRDDIIFNVLLSDDVPSIVKSRSFLGLVWLVMPYIGSVRKLVRIPEEIQMSDDEILGYVYVNWGKFEEFVFSIYKERKG